MTIRGVQIFQPLHNCSNKIHRIQIFLIGKKKQCEGNLLHLDNLLHLEGLKSLGEKEMP